MTEQERLAEIKKQLAKAKPPMQIKVAPNCPTDPAERAACDSCQ